MNHTTGEAGPRRWEFANGAEVKSFQEASDELAERAGWKSGTKGGRPGGGDPGGGRVREGFRTMADRGAQHRPPLLLSPDEYDRLVEELTDSPPRYGAAARVGGGVRPVYVQDCPGEIWTPEAIQRTPWIDPGKPGTEQKISVILRLK